VKAVIALVLGLLAVPAFAAAPPGQPLDDSALSGQTASEMKTYQGLVNAPPVLQPQDPKNCAGAPAEAGIVGLRMQIGRDGRIGEILVVVPSGSTALDEASASYIKNHWRFKPANVAGRDVVSWLNARIAFDGNPANCPVPTRAALTVPTP
jgi:outer membrane biosynthesis protein TonB